MRRTLSLFALGIAPAACQTSYLAGMADSFILNGVAKDYHYSGATIYLGYEAAYDLTQNETYYSWYKEQIDAVVLDNGTIDNWNYTKYSLDNYVSLIWLYHIAYSNNRMVIHAYAPLP
jgi:hypothetical protein